MSKPTSAVKNRWNEKNYDRITITPPKGRKADIEAYAEKQGLSVNALICEMLRSALEMSPEDWNSKEEPDVKLGTVTLSQVSPLSAEILTPINFAISVSLYM